MRDVVEIARTMGPEQLFLALVFLASYSLALGEFATARGRAWAVVSGLVAAGAFAALSHPWEGGVVLVACASVGMALFSATVSSADSFREKSRDRGSVAGRQPSV